MALLEVDGIHTTIAAASDALRRGRFVLVLVPSRVLMEQWHTALRAALPEARIGRLGDDGRDTAESCDVLVATRHSAAAYKPIPPGAAGGLLIADECHGLGGKTLRRALLPAYEERLGLTATLERGDDGPAPVGEGTMAILVLAIATSIDALAVGLVFSFQNVNIPIPALFIGLVTFVLTLMGVYLGIKVGHFFEKRIGVVGGLILIGIGAKILVEHLRGHI
jgi:xanthosine utilization system XapX-like protein